MKKPDVEFAIVRLSLQEWREQMGRDDQNEEDKALQNAKDGLRKDHQKELARKVAGIIKKAGLTKKQLEVFASFVETGSFRETARLINKDQAYVFRVVEKVQNYVKKELGRSTPAHK